MMSTVCVMAMPYIIKHAALHFWPFFSLLFGCHSQFSFDDSTVSSYFNAQNNIEWNVAGFFFACKKEIKYSLFSVEEYIFSDVLTFVFCFFLFFFCFFCFSAFHCVFHQNCCIVVGNVLMLLRFLSFWFRISGNGLLWGLHKYHRHSSDVLKMRYHFVNENYRDAENVG